MKSYTPTGWKSWTFATQVKILANQFTARLRLHLSREDFMAMQAATSQEPKPAKGFCHSFKFCDANKVMTEAFESLTHRNVRSTYKDSKVCAEAWQLAKVNWMANPLQPKAGPADEKYLLTALEDLLKWMELSKLYFTYDGAEYQCVTNARTAIKRARTLAPRSHTLER